MTAAETVAAEGTPTPNGPWPPKGPRKAGPPPKGPCPPNGPREAGPPPNRGAGGPTIGTRGTGTNTGGGTTGMGTGAGGAAGTGAIAGGLIGCGAATGAGAAILGLAWITGAGAGLAGTTMFSLGLGRSATVGRMPIARAISSATTAVMKMTASALPTSRNDLRIRAPSSSPRTVGASASSSGTAL